MKPENEQTPPADEGRLEATVMKRLERLLQLEVMCVMRAADAEWWKLNRERETELRSLRAALHDAERYRWVRDKSPPTWVMEAEGLPLFKGDFDAAIDRAMARGPAVGAA